MTKATRGGSGGRKRGLPMYPGKSVQGSHLLTKAADRKVRAASKRTGKSDSDILEHAVHTAGLDALTKADAEAITAANNPAAAS
ncbi:MAG: hypothetical protein V4597_08455 [Pseudomonadota bacterium]